MTAIRRADLRGAVDNLALVLTTIQRSKKVTSRRIYGVDLPSPRLDLLQMADIPMNLAWFYIGSAGGGYGR
jgi:hypothetical protein